LTSVVDRPDWPRWTRWRSIWLSAQDLRALLDPVAGHVPLGLRGTQAEFGTGGDRVAELLGQVDQAAQQVLELFDGDAADRLRAGHLRQQEAHFGLVVGLAHGQQGIERREHVARHRRDAVHRGLGIPRQQAMRAQARQHGFEAFGDQVGQLLVDVGAREGRGGAVGCQLAQHQQADQHTVGAAVEQRGERLQGRLRALQVEHLLDLIGRDAGVEVRLQRIGVVLLKCRCFRGQRRACQCVDHCVPDTSFIRADRPPWEDDPGSLAGRQYISYGCASRQKWRCQSPVSGLTFVHCAGVRSDNRTYWGKIRGRDRTG
jgi:hypothetical protein